MPFLRADAADWVPDSETLDTLLGMRNRANPSTTQIKTLQELGAAERKRTGLIKLKKRKTKIPGDPFGLYYGWSGNVGHPMDKRMVSSPFTHRRGT